MVGRRVLVRGLISAAIAIAIASSPSWGNQTTLRPEAAARQVYAQIPDLPRANTYTRSDTGMLDPENTLISRFIRYHQDVKKRFTDIRLDWQLTLADYLGAHEAIVVERYPGSNTLTANPMTTDIELIQALNRRQREQLVTVLVRIYNPDLSTSPAPTPSPSPIPNPRPSPRTPPLSQPGDANLLK
jgi:hypothetical protein